MLLKTISFILLLSCSFIATAQEQYEDIIYLKNDMVLRGRILERQSDGSVRMRQSDGREIVVSIKEIKNVVVQGIGSNPSDYGGKTAFGISLFGDGIFGVNFRLRAANELYANLSVQPGAVVLVNDVTDEARVEWGLGIGGELNYFLKRKFKESKQKVRANGLFFRTSHNFGDFETTRFSFGWSSEYFKLNRFKRGFLLNLGFGYTLNHWFDNPLNAVYLEGRRELEPGLYFRLQWNFFQ